MPPDSLLTCSLPVKVSLLFPLMSSVGYLPRFRLFLYIFYIGIKHGFSYINIRQVPREVLKTEVGGRGFQHLPRDLANVNALKKTCFIAIIAYKLKTLSTFCIISCTILFCLFTDVSRTKFLRTVPVLGPGRTLRERCVAVH